MSATDFEQMCSRLDKCKCKKICHSNNYLCAKKAVREFCDGDMDKLMLLKCQAQTEDFEFFSSFTFSAAALVISFASFFIQMTSNDNEKQISSKVNEVVDKVISFSLMDKYFLLIAMVIILFVIVVTKRFYVKNWRSYILNAIDDVELEIRKNI